MDITPKSPKQRFGVYSTPMVELALIYLAIEEEEEEKFEVERTTTSLAKYYDGKSTTPEPDDLCWYCNKHIENSIFPCYHQGAQLRPAHFECAHPDRVVITKKTTSNYDYYRFQRRFYDQKTEKQYNVIKVYYLDAKGKIRLFKPVQTKCCKEVTHKRNYHLVEMGKIFGFTIMYKRCVKCGKHFSYRKIRSFSRTDIK